MTSPTSSPWSDKNPVRAATPLAADISCDVCVVGGGIAGLTAAYLLAGEGKSVTVLESKEAVAGGETEFTTAHLAWVLDDRYARLAAVRGDGVAKTAADSHRAAIDLIGEIVAREKIECGFKRVDGFLFPGTDGPAVVEEEEEALKRLGIPYELAVLPFASPHAGPVLRFAGNGQFHPIRYLGELAGLVRNRGGTIHTNTHVVKIESGSPCRVRTKDERTVTAGAVVVAANAPFDAGVTLHVKMAAYTTYAFAAPVPAGTIPVGLYWDTEDPYHYVRTQPAESGMLLIVGGEDHKTGQADDQADRWGRLISWARERFPGLGEVKHRWSGQVFETPDGLGLIGRAPGGRDNEYVITGDSGMGMTHGTLGARLVTDLILGRANDLAGVYSPSRWMPGAAKTFLKENLNLAAQYADWLTGGDVESADRIPPGHGAIVRSGLTKLAVYRDDKGTVHTMSATCPHMGGVVRWNPGEQTWDCPCHGSRFGCEGNILHGPAVEGLAPAK
jgi:glycine/D-amino acid oxidase-like deaminating enzyme/nitrite reductase/ring-hydroxylating ferredoxin subunit